MKQFYITTLLLCGGLLSANAQTPEIGDKNAPVKLEDLVKEYKQEHSNNRTVNEVGGAVEEGENHHFDRWYWYWQQHTDENGYMVGPYQNYIEAINANRASSKTTADQSDWKFMGPTSSPSGYNGIGRINVIEFHPTNKNQYWIGSAGGGAWMTDNDGVSWTNMTEQLPVLGVSDIDYNPQNPRTMYLCPGDRDASDTYSVGVLKSTDGGITWNATGLVWNKTQNRLSNCLVINPADTNSLTLAASDGIHKSYDGGQTWTMMQGGHFKQVLYHPTDTNILYAPRYNNNRQIYRSTDGGKNWSVVSNFNNARRIQLAVTPQRPGIVKAVVCKSDNGLMGIYHSSNSGANGSFNLIYAPSGSNCNGNLITGNLSGNGCGKQGWYDLSIIINPQDSTEVYVGGVNTWGSNNGGVSWQLVTQWYGGLSGIKTVHADKHYHKYHPLVPGRLFECNDGGVYKTDAPQSTLWTDISNGLGITQFYRNAVTNAATYALAGSQDNGTKKLTGTTWTEETGGDGMNCEADPIDSNVFYTAIQNGELRRTINGGGSYTDISNNIPSNPSGAWITPYKINPNNNQHLVAGYKHVYYSQDRGNNWYSIQGSEITGGNALRVAISGSSPTAIYAIFPDSPKTVFVARNFVPGSTATFDTISVPYGGSISDILPHPTDSNRFWLTYSGYNSAQFVEYNNGVWTQNKTGLPNVPVRCVEFDSSRNVLYVGTDIAVYYNDTSTSNVWASFRKNMPNIEVTDLGINYTTDEIWAATYGRGLWSSVLQGSVKVIPPDTSDTTNSVAIIPYAEDVFVVAPNPNSGHFTVIVRDNIKSGEAVTVSMVDYTGKVVYSRTATISGNKSIEVATENVPVGVYIVEMSNDKAILGRNRVVIR
ncbi:MAG: T9SS type A sorting domain-containing protein [Chitinophagaceae bacterium]|nr:T9SS type A sorting domain-containing protein [Chitinophagaceae bacterium]